MMSVGKLIGGAALLLLLPHAINACRCQGRPPVCDAVDNADVVVRAVLVSSMDIEKTTFWTDSVLEVVEVFKSETGVEKYAVGEEFNAFTPGSSNSCGAWTDFGEEYLVDLVRHETGLYTNIPCGISRNWGDLSADDEESLRGCTCEGGCGTFQECVRNTQGYLQDGDAVETFCSDVCDPSPCNDGEACELLLPTCLGGEVCPAYAVCTPDTFSPEPTPAPTTPVEIISCASYECDSEAGYTNVDRECSTVASPSGGIWGRRLQSSDDSTFITTDGYTTLGNYPICSQDVCCEGGPTPAPTDVPQQAQVISLGCFKDVRNERIMDLTLVDYSMTTELCELTCTGSAYFSTQYGRECWCGPAETDYAQHGVSTGCTYQCAGNPDERCGGFYAANVYAYSTASYVGCFKDARDRIMELALRDTSSMTKEMCEAECTGRTYFGLQYGRECWCGDEDTNLSKHGESTECSFECPGDPDQTCGGRWAMSVYEFN